MLKQTLQQKLLQKLSPQQIQLMKLLEVPTVALEQRIKEELEVNPALEEGHEEMAQDDYSDDSQDQESERTEDEFDITEYLTDDDIPDYKTYARNTSQDDEEKSVPLSMGKSFHEVLMAQLGLRRLDEQERQIAETIVGNIDESGYLRREIESITDDLAFTQGISTDDDTVLSLLRLVQDLEPAGVGARDLQECLLLQIKRKPERTPHLVLAEIILEKYFEEFTKKHYSKILSRLSITEENLKASIDEILKLNPKPGGSFNENQRSAQHVIPDFVLTLEDGEVRVGLNSRNAPDLRVSRTYAEMLKAYSAGKDKMSKSDKEAVMFVKQKLDSAKWFIDAIRQRQHTLLTTIQAIVEYQHDFFLEGDEALMKPMILKDIADKIGLDISTVSRVANSKYIQTPYGTYLIKYFFSESMQTDSGEEVSTREIKSILQRVIGEEEKRKPLTDEKLATILKEKGYNIARRTVAKYREQLNIPVARLRKEL